MDLTISIVNWNTRDDLCGALQAIVGSGMKVTYEIIVVDNASTDGSTAMLRDRFPNVKLIEIERNVGFGAGHNRAFAAGLGKYRLVMNPDSRPLSGAFDELLRFAEAHVDAAIVAPKLLNPDGSLQYSCRRFPSVAAAIFRNALFDRLFPNNRAATDYLMRDWDHAVPREVDWVSGAAMLIRADALEKLHGFDESYFMYCEDTDICRRARDAGFTVWYDPNAVFTHTIGRSTDAEPNRMAREHHRSMYRYYKKYTAATTPVWVRPLVPVGLWLRAQATVARNVWNLWRRR